jgi:preprotein translocase subunit SecE
MNQQADQQTSTHSADEQQLSFWRYKPGQGYWTRTLSALGAMALAAAGAGWMWGELEGSGLYVQATVATIIVLVMLGLVWYLFNKPNIVDFLIATEAEMKKVNWPTRREIIGSTWLVIAGTFMMALLLYGIDVIFLELFRLINVIKV